MKLSIQKRMLFLIAFFGVSIGHLFSQSTMGTNFWVAFGKNNTLENVAGISLQIKIVTGKATTATFTFSELTGSGSTVTVNIPANSVYTRELSAAEKAAVYSINRGVITSKSLRINTTEPVSVYALNQRYQGADATNLLPESACGTDYYLISYSGGYLSEGNNGFDAYAVVARTADTEVFQNGSLVATLKRGEVFYHSFNWQSDYSRDGTGVRITSNKPIACFAVNQFAFVPNDPSINQTGDNLFQQLPPINQWGTRFLVPNTKQGIGRVRILASQGGTTITQVGATIPANGGGTKSLGPLNAGQYVELEFGPSGCYVYANKPVGVCSYMITASHVTAISSGKGDAAMAWIPPIEQSLKEVLITPFVPSNTTNLAEHYALIVVPTQAKAKTTVALGTASPSAISGVTWVDNAASGFSFGSYRLWNAANSYKIANPEGLTVSGYGIGDIESYYYVSGSATRNLDAYFNINGILYQNFARGSTCNNYNFQAFVNYPIDPAAGSLKWHINGVEQLAVRDRRTWDTTLLPGTYTVNMVVKPLSESARTYTATFVVENVKDEEVIALVWTPGRNTAGSDSDKQNWHDKRNWTPNEVPSLCTDVYIPGNCGYYPLLKQSATCRDIYFIQGSELGRPDLLKTYNKARVHLNLGLKMTTQSSSDDVNLILNGYDTKNRLRYSAGRSTPLDRERWYMLSSPLRNVVSGDFGFGGFPLAYMQKFGPITKDGTNYPVGEWTDTYTSMKEPLSITEGFAYFVYGYDSGSAANSLRNRGCLESGNINDFAYFPERVGGYGLKEINGILELPFYEDRFQREAHRTQKYDGINKSTFYYIADGTYPDAMYNQIVNRKIDEVARESANLGSYRFIAENRVSGNWQFANPVYHSGAGLGSSTEFMVGNPYMSSLDMIEFYKDNSALLEPQFRIWDGTDFVSFDINVANNEILPTVPGESDYIAPMQAFFLVTKTDYANQNIKFDVTKISKVRPFGTPANLRSGKEEENIIRIQASNNISVSHALIAGRENASHSYQKGEDIYKLFSPSAQLPQVYTLADEIPLDMNFINPKGEITIPIGLKTDYRGMIHLTFSGMNNYFQASKIEFMDVVGNKIIDITDEDSFTYSFNNQKEGISNGQFFLRFSSSATDISDVLLEDVISVYRNQSVLSISSTLLDPIQRIVIYDLQGKVLYNLDFLNTNFYTINTPTESSLLIVQVTTKTGSKTVKLNK